MKDIYINHNEFLSNHTDQFYREQMKKINDTDHIELFDLYLKYKLKYNSFSLSWLKFYNLFAILILIFLVDMVTTTEVSITYYQNLKWGVFVAAIIYFMILNLFNLKFKGYHYIIYLLVGFGQAFNCLIFNPFYLIEFSKDTLWFILIIAMLVLFGSLHIKKLINDDKQQYCNVTNMLFPGKYYVKENPYSNVL